MKSLLTIVFLLSSISGFSQTKVDVVECLNLIMGQDEFQVAFTNDLTSNGAIVITATGKPNLRRSDLMQIRNSLTQDDFYDFDHPIKVVVSGYEDLETLGINPFHILEFFMSGNEKQLNFSLNSVIKNENLKYIWQYNLVKVDEEWEIVGRSMRTNRWR